MVSPRRAHHTCRVFAWRSTADIDRAILAHLMLYFRVVGRLRVSGDEERGGFFDAKWMPMIRVVTAVCPFCGATCQITRGPLGLVCKYCDQPYMAEGETLSEGQRGKAASRLSAVALKLRLGRLHDEMNAIEADFRDMTRQCRYEQIPYALVAYCIPAAWAAFLIVSLIRHRDELWREAGMYAVFAVFSALPVVACLHVLCESRRHWTPILANVRRDIQSKGEELAAAMAALSALSAEGEHCPATEMHPR